MNNRRVRNSGSVGAVEFPPLGLEGFADWVFTDIPLLRPDQLKVPKILFVTPCDLCRDICTPRCFG